ncbi:hypothetical protein [Kitasatospora purpeofusca]|uniref:Secreted protein n=1 Tax=Kitasatospora purpeofusca TaxID=67352 RepID=A0ABZ1UBD5_9ACTN|nr:hypothetical protein [Kitasatospora purpeofusca]
MLVRRTVSTILTTITALCASAVPTATVHAAAPEVLNCLTNAAVHFSPPLSATAQAVTVTIAGTVSGCTDSQTGATAITGGRVTTTLHFASLSCNPLLPATLKPGASAAFTWNLANGTRAGSTVTGLALSQIAGAGTLTGTVTGSSPRLAGEHLTSLLNIDSDQPIIDNCVDVLLGIGAPIANSTLTADIAFG